MKKLTVFGIATAALLAVSSASAAPAEAQGRGHGRYDVPRGQLPPAGLCRIWLDGVPPGHQPPPMDCWTAERRAPRNSRVIYGSDYDRGRGYDRGDRGGDRDYERGGYGRYDKHAEHGRDADDDDDQGGWDRSDRRDSRQTQDGCLLRNAYGVCILGSSGGRNGSSRGPSSGQPVILGIPVPR